MRLSSARELKEELRRHACRNLLEKRSYAIRGLGDPLITEAPRSVAAIGVSPMSRRNQYAVAIRVFRGHEADAAPLIRKVAHLKSEVDLATGVQYRPHITVQAGGSCGHYDIGAGTLGGFVEDEDSYFILSNNHVLANSDNADLGDPILQPGPADVRNRYTVIGTLHRWVPLRQAGSVDAAIAALAPTVKYFYPWEYRGIGTMVPTPVADRYTTSKVVKRGRTTLVTHGRVSAFELDDIAINYGTRRRPKRVVYHGQLEFVGAPDSRRPFSQPGDSGSFILDAATLQPYALLYGGGPDAQGIDRTLGQFMPDVLSSLGVWLVQ